MLPLTGAHADVRSLRRQNQKVRPPQANQASLYTRTPRRPMMLARFLPLILTREGKKTSFSNIRFFEFTFFFTFFNFFSIIFRQK
jgi:hypothetical protein